MAEKISERAKPIEMGSLFWQSCCGPVMQDAAGDLAPDDLARFWARFMYEALGQMAEDLPNHEAMVLFELLHAATREGPKVVLEFLEDQDRESS